MSPAQRIDELRPDALAVEDVRSQRDAVPRLFDGSTHSVAARGSRLKMTACPAVGIVTTSGTRVAAHVSPLGSDTTASHRSRFAAR